MDETALTVRPNADVAPPVKRKPRAKRTASEEADRFLNKMSPKVISAFWEKLLERVNQGDERALQHVRKMFYEKNSPLVQVIQQNANTNVNVGADQPRTIDGILLKLQKQANDQRSAPAPEPEIIEVEPVAD